MLVCFHPLSVLGYLRTLKWGVIGAAVAFQLMVVPSNTDFGYADNCSLVSSILPQAKVTKNEWIGVGGFVASIFLLAGALIWLPPLKSFRKIGGELMTAAIVFAILVAIGFTFLSKAIPLPCSVFG